MGEYSFRLFFIFGAILVIFGGVFAFMKMSSLGYSLEDLSVLWSAILLLVVLLGIILISFFINRNRQKVDSL